ncbi:hypothetical protein [Streptomyces fulvorobeus]|uniref:Uncharacterized protein n=1 Tax=Streptomyces fulvorobeus TaxID=284028 RepID=A0A7J0CG93_9ACTN|nr:hypothetical protein [Streptomyces fulvorobeus]NYE44842.1 hypothetical protein [Streptomyces fulvorobeus]GFN01439.1 hypothetical protein Sfulv_62490 [Streptomyces fulvorobeus]
MNAIYIYFGPSRQTWRMAEMPERDVYLTIGKNTLAGFEPVTFVFDAEGRRLRTPDGELLTVVALTGGTGRVVSAMALTGGR